MMFSERSQWIARFLPIRMVLLGFRRFARILEEAARVSSDACFGLHFGERYNPKNIGSLVYVVLNSPTIAAGIENTARFIKIHNEAARASLLVEKDRAYLRFLPNELLIHTSRQHSEYAMAVALNTLRLMVGSEWAPQEVHFTHQLDVGHSGAFPRVLRSNYVWLSGQCFCCRE